MGKSTISMAIFNSEMLVYQRVTPILGGKNYGFPGKMFPSTNPLRRVAKLNALFHVFLVYKDFRLELADRTTYH